VVKGFYALSCRLWASGQDGFVFWGDSVSLIRVDVKKWVDGPLARTRPPLEPAVRN